MPSGLLPLTLATLGLSCWIFTSSCSDLTAPGREEQKSAKVEGSGGTTGSQSDDDGGEFSTRGNKSDSNSKKKSGNGDKKLDQIEPIGTANKGPDDEGSIFDKYKDKFDNFSDEEFAPIQPFERFTGGSGGAAGGVSGVFQASNGVSSQYRIFVPAGGGSDGVIVYFHGDGNILDFSLIAGTVDSVATARNMIAVVAKASDSFSWWYDLPFEHAQFIHELLQAEVFAKYNADAGNLFFAGSSGGANFIAAYFVPQYGYYYQATYISLCGGEKNRSGRFKSNEVFKDNSQMVFVTAKGDNLMIDQANRAVAYYEDKEMAVDASFPEGTGHCNFSITGLIDQYVGQYRK